MLFPVRCFTCSKVIADKWDEYNKKIQMGKSKKEILDEMGMERYCCRRMFLSHVETIDELLLYEK